MNKNYNDLGNFISLQRRKRGISQKDLSKGIISIATLSRIESGERTVDKLIVDTLLQRIGVSADYFEIIITNIEFILLHQREQIRIAYNEKKYNRALDLIEKYEENKGLHLLYFQYAEEIKARIAIKMGEDLKSVCQHLRQIIQMTVPDFPNIEWKRCCLSSSEIEIITLFGEIQWKVGRKKEASKIWKHLIDYIHRCDIEIQEQIKFLPHIRYCMSMQMEEEQKLELAIEECKRGIQMLLQERSLRYLIQLLMRMEQLFEKLEKNQGLTYSQNIERMQTRAKIEMFLQIHKMNGLQWDIIYPMQTFQSCYLLSEILQRRRNAMRVIQENICEDELSVQALSNIECGKSVPRKNKNLEKLLKKIYLPPTRYMAYLQGVSMETLDLERKIRKALNSYDYVKIRQLLNQLKITIDQRYSRNQQFLLYINAIVCLEGKSSMQILEKLNQALSCTMPKVKIENWVFTQYESMIINTIAIVYRKLGKCNEAIELLQKLSISNQESKINSIVLHSDSELTIRNLIKLFEEKGEYQKVIHLYKEVIKRKLVRGEIDLSLNLYYHNLFVSI